MATKHMTLTAAFAAFGARLANYRKTSSLIADDGALVFSFWSVFFEPSSDSRVYEDDFRRWKNPVGREVAREHLRFAFEKKRPVRLVMAFPKDPEALKAGAVVTGSNKWSVRKDLVGEIKSFDGNKFIVRFKPNG